MQSERLSNLASVLHKVGDDGRLWVDYCNELTRLFDAVGTVMISLETQRRALRIFHSDGLEKLLQEYRRDGWYQRDHRQRLVPILLERGIVFDTDIATLREISTLPYYRDFLARHGIGGFFGMLVNTRYGAWCAGVQLPIGRMMPSPEDIALAPAIRQMTETAAEKAAESALARRNIWAGTLRETGSETAVCDWEGNVLATSGGLASMLAPVCKIGKRFEFASRGDQTELDAALRGCFAAEADAMLPAPIILDGGGATVLVDFARFPSSLVHFFDQPEIIALFRPIAASGKSQADQLAKRFGLTRSEIELVSELALGHLLKDAALALGITEGTARQRLKSIFRKTETEAQHQLVSKVLGMGGAFAAARRER